MVSVAAFNPAYTTGQIVTPISASANVAIAKDSKHLALTNIGPNVCYIRIGDSASMVATTADYPVPSSAQVVIGKGYETRLAYMSPGGTTLHIISGKGL